MNRIYLTAVVIIIAFNFLYPQEPYPSTPNNNNEYDVIKTDANIQRFEFVPNEILVRFKDDLKTILGKTNGYASIGSVSVDMIMQKYKVVKISKLFPQEKELTQKRLLKTANGKVIEQQSLHNIYKLNIDSTNQVNFFEVIEEFKKDPSVIYAEPNYILSIVETKALSPELNESEMQEWVKEHSSASPMTNNQSSINNQQSTIPNDPLYEEQWAIPACQVDAVWDSTKGDSTQIIAILDTGVDWLHPDLKDNTWINIAEANGAEGFDDDGNGKIDDIRGWDFINWDNNPLDDNGHGTHVAGIAAAKGNNGIGIAGVSWNAKILPIKVINSSGKGDAATISQGINYASSKGATIINMSFGGYFKSYTMEAALKNAALTSELVAAAGNDHLSIYPKTPNPWDASTMYPAAFPFVLGVQVIEGFSNYDPDGPIYSTFETGENYELLSYGGGIISTYPGGKYKLLSGTSMGAPLVSGIIALYNSKKNNPGREDRWADFINLSRPVNAYTNIFQMKRNRFLTWFLLH